MRKKPVLWPFFAISVGLLTGLTAFRSEYLAPQIHLQNRHLVNAAQLPYAAGRAESNRAPKQKSPPRPVPGGRKGGRPMLLDAVSTLASLGLEGLHGVPGLFHRASHEPAHRVLLPSHALHDLREGGAVLALQHGDHLGRLAARARCGHPGHRGRLLGRGRFLGGGGLLGYLTLGGRALGRPCATLGLAFGFGLGGWCRLRQRAQSLNALPDAAGGGLVVLELLDGLHAGQAAPDRHQPLRRPRLGQFGKLRLAAEAVERRGGCGGSLLRGGMRRDVVVGVNRKSRHRYLSFVSARCAVMTWITPHDWKRKAILNNIDDGERAAMAGGPSRARSEERRVGKECRSR